MREGSFGRKRLDTDFTPVLHIGYHKTGTTWFQKEFYPACRGAAFVPRRRVRQAFLAPTAFSFDAAEAERTLALPPGRRPILCEEGLVGYYGNAGLLQALSKDMAFRLHAVFPQARIVIFLRNQPDMLTATYLQYVRRGGTRDAARFFHPYDYGGPFRTKAFKKPMFSLHHLDYHHLVRHYRRLFGAENVHVFLYEEFRQNPRAFLRSYAERLGLEPEMERIDFASRNVSYGTRATRLARLLNHVTVDDTADSVTLLPLLPRKANEAIMGWIQRAGLVGRKVTLAHLLDRETIGRLEAFYAPGNRRLEEELGLSLSRHGYPLPDDARPGGADERQPGLLPA